MPLGQLSPDVPELLQVHGRGALGCLDAEGRQAARAAGARLMIFALCLLGQGEEGLCIGYGGVDHRLVQSVVGDDRKAIAFERRSQFVGEGLEVGVIQLHRHRLDRLAGGR